ncbi:Uncharacterised protein [Shigella sonnei]|nr:Uncharacterised protein [Shigella sonnei]CSP52178.1 Uncharacterised protein [Shigella sonnei]SRN44225.1 Uncharacterised protein [Shigella flexneri]
MVGVVEIALNRNICHAIGADHQAWFIGGAAAMKRCTILGCGERTAPAAADGTVIIGGIGTRNIPLTR